MNDFNTIHSLYLGWGVKFRRSQKIRFKKYLEILKNVNVNGNVLEVGCSIGIFTNILFKKFHFHLTGIDISEVAIERAKKINPDVRFEVQSLPKLTFQDNSFKLVTALEVLYYLSQEDQEKALHEIYRVIAPNGYFLISSHIGNAPYFLPAELEELVSRYFSIISTNGLFIRQYYHCMEKKLFKFLTLLSQNKPIELDKKNIRKRKQIYLFNLVFLNKIARHSYSFILIFILRLILFIMPILLIEIVSKWLTKEKSRHIHIVLAKKV